MYDMRTPQAAAALQQRAEDILRRLEQLPESGRIIPNFPDLPYRKVVVRPCRFFHRIKGATVWIVAAWHDSQLPATQISRLPYLSFSTT